MPDSSVVPEANNVVNFPSSTITSPSNLEDFQKLLIDNKMECIDAFTDELMSEIIRICYSYGYMNLDSRDISYAIIVIKSLVARAENITVPFHDRIDKFIAEKLSEKEEV